MTSDEMLLAVSGVEYQSDFNSDERCGVILASGEVLELPNRSSYPKNSFVIATQDTQELSQPIIATWHTHPRGPNNLSIDDYNTFLDLDNLHHIIITSKSLSLYKAVDGYVMNIQRKIL